MLVRVALEEGRAQRPRPARAIWQASSARPMRPSRRGWLAVGDVPAAQAELRKAPPFQAQVVPPEVRYDYALSEIRVQAAAGDVAGAKRRLEMLLASTSQAGLKLYELEARLMLGELEVRSGHADAGRARLQAVEAEATASGLGLLARHARQ